MPVPQRSEIHPSKVNPLPLVGIPTLEVDEEEKYWKFKIVHSALESVAFSCNPNPKLPFDVVSRLRKILHDGQGHETNDEPFSPETKSILTALISREIENASETVVKTQIQLLKNSHLKENQEWYSKLCQSDNPLEEVLKIVQRRRQEETELDGKLDEARALRMEEVNKMEDKLSQVKQSLENAVQNVTKLKDPEEVRRKLDVLKNHSEVLALRMEVSEKERILLENPPEVTSATQEALDALLEANEKLKQENDALSTFCNEHDALPPHMKALLTELQRTDESIKRQQWILKSLKGYEESENGNESFF